MIDIVLPERLPGKEAHLKLAPEPRVITLMNEQTPPTKARESAVLVLLLPPKEGEELKNGGGVAHFGNWRVLLIKRNHYKGVHSGQVSFPGGKCENWDRDYTATACREAYEELGIKSEKIKIVGPLSSLYVPPSNFIIYPILALSNVEHNYKEDEREVNHTLEVPLSLFNPNMSERFRVETRAGEWVWAPGYSYNGEIIWGATAMIISELYQVLSDSSS